MHSSKISKSTIVVDGRVFSTDAHDRGMGRYVRFVIQTLATAGYQICLVIYKNSRLKKDDPLILLCKKLENIAIDPAVFHEQDIHHCSHAIEIILKKNSAAAYVDATPFIFPMRLDITECPVIAVAYDLIPLRHPANYNCNVPSVVVDLYENALRRLIKADSIIAISNYTKELIFKYLGINKNRIHVIYPSLEEDYFEAPSTEYKSIDFFGILGSHFSKNPQFALELFNHLNDQNKFTYKISVPTESQLHFLKNEFPSLTKTLSIKASIIEREKIFSQAHAKVVFHVSRDEGFGIPLLEALFKHTRVVCCDIRINREILEKCEGEISRIAYLISKETNDPKIIEFIESPECPQNAQLFDNIRNYFLSHWKIEAPQIAKNAIETASDVYNDFSKNIVAKMVCNTPSEFCGVADYAYSIPLGIKKNMLIYTADTSVKKMHALENIRLKSHFCFRSDLEISKPTIFHLAVSESLYFGIELLRQYGASKDIVILHDHNYLYGLYHINHYNKKTNEFLNNYFVDCDNEIKNKIERKKHINFDEFKDATKGYSSAWLRKAKIKLVNHLTEAAELEFSQLFSTNIPSEKQFVDIGTDDKVSCVTLRTGKMWRQQKNISTFDLLIGIFGSVTSNKYISEIASAVSKASALMQTLPSENPFSLHFIICGKVHEKGIFDQAEACFKNNGQIAYLHHENPVSDQRFDALLTASDIVISCRKQDRGQLSHIIPRSLSLGRPLLTNAKSGYDMISRDCIIDDKDFESNLIEKLCYFVRNRDKLKDISHSNRRLFEEKHLMNHYFEKIVDCNHEKGI